MALNEKAVKSILHTLAGGLTFQSEAEQNEFHAAIDDAHKAPSENGEDNGEDKDKE